MIKAILILAGLLLLRIILSLYVSKRAPYVHIDGYMDMDKAKEMCPEIFDKKAKEKPSE